MAKVKRRPLRAVVMQLGDYLVETVITLNISLEVTQKSKQKKHLWRKRYMQTNPQQYARAVWQEHISYNISQLPSYTDLKDYHKAKIEVREYMQEIEEITNYKERLYDREAPQRKLTEAQLKKELSKPEKLINLGNCYIENFDFRKFSLAEAVLTMATFVNCNFEKVQMQRCELSETQFINCNLKGVIA